MGWFDALRRGFQAKTHATPLETELERAVSLHEAGELQAAAALYRTILARQSRHPEALHLLGVVLHQRGDHMAALQSINAAILVKRDVALFHFNLGNVLTALQEPQAAADGYAEAVRLKPDYAAAWFNLGKARFQTANYDGAQAALRKAFELDDSLPGLRFDFAAALIAHGDRLPGTQHFHREAAALLEQHWQEGDNPHAARLMLAYSLQQQLLLSDAEKHYRAVLESQAERSDRLKAHSNLANCYNQLGRVEEALHHYRETLRLNPALADTASSIAAFINYHPNTTPQDVLDAHLDWARRFADPSRTAAEDWDNDRSGTRALRVGLVSPDLRRHPVAALCAAALERLDGRSVQVHCYYNYASEDQVSARLRNAAAGWRNIVELADAAAADIVRQDGIDILIDMAGHTTNNRLGLFALKPAPLQVSWLGYFNTTGLDTMDYFITDPHSSPPGQEAYFTERLLRLPHTRFCYEPWEWMPPVNALPALERGYISFGCFNNLAKINTNVLSLWSRVLQAVPHSRLIVQAFALGDGTNRARFLAAAAAAGIAPERLELRAFAPLDKAAYAYHDIDIALDPFPFCGGMTSFESLWMGVPVVTLEQTMIAGRQTLAMLHNLGLSHCVAASEEQYVAIAAALAHGLRELAGLRCELRPRFAASPLADYDRFATDFATALRGIWRDWLGHGPSRRVEP